MQTGVGGARGGGSEQCHLTFIPPEMIRRHRNPCDGRAALPSLMEHGEDAMATGQEMGWRQVGPERIQGGSGVGPERMSVQTGP